MWEQKKKLMVTRENVKYFWVGKIQRRMKRQRKTQMEEGSRCASHHSLAMTGYLGPSTYKEESFILAYSFRSFSPWSGNYYFRVSGETEICGGERCSSDGSRETARVEVWFQYPLQGHTPSDLTFSTMPHLLKFTLLPNSIIGWWPSLLHMAFGEHLRSQQ
jgi:hypothetical protein